MSNSPFIIGTMRLGTWGAQLSTQELERYIDTCIDLGCTDFDHADIYGHYTEEEHFGTVIKRRPDLKNKLRHTTKCGIKLVCDQRPNYTLKSYDTRKEHILFSAENSLRYLGVDQIDTLLIHRPDFLMDIEEVAEAFHTLKKEGKVKAFGVSNFTSAQVEALHSFIPLLSHQVEYSLLHTEPLENGLIEQCKTLDIRLEAWSPFKGGAIFSEESSAVHDRIKAVAQDMLENYNCSLDQLLLAWITKHPYNIRPVLGTSKISRLRTAIASRNITLSHEEWYRLLEAARGHEVA